MKSLKMIFVTLALAALLLGACVAPPAATTSAPVASPAASADTEAAAGPSASSALTTTIPSTTTLVPLKDAVATMDPQDVWQNFYELTQIPRPSHHEEQVRDCAAVFRHSDCRNLDLHSTHPSGDSNGDSYRNRH